MAFHGRADSGPILRAYSELDCAMLERIGTLACKRVFQWIIEECEHAIVFESLDLFVGQRVDPFVLMILCY